MMMVKRTAVYKSHLHRIMLASFCPELSRECYAASCCHKGHAHADTGSTQAQDRKDLTTYWDFIVRFMKPGSAQNYSLHHGLCSTQKTYAQVLAVSWKESVTQLLSRVWSSGYHSRDDSLQ